MWTYDRRLQYPVKIACPNANTAKIIITQFGGPDGELAASQRYLSQRYSMPIREVAGVLTDIGTEDAKWPPVSPKKAAVDGLHLLFAPVSGTMNNGYRPGGRPAGHSKSEGLYEPKGSRRAAPPA